VKCRPDARGRIEEQSDGLRRIVAGAAEGLEPGAVALVVAESAAPPVRPPERTVSRPWLAGSAMALAVILGAGALSLGRRRSDDR
jgi:type III secretion protein J